MKLRRGQASLAKFGVYGEVPGVSGWFGDGIFFFETRQSEQIPLVIADPSFMVQVLSGIHSSTLVIMRVNRRAIEMACRYMLAMGISLEPRLNMYNTS